MHRAATSTSDHQYDAAAAGDASEPFHLQLQPPPPPQQLQQLSNQLYPGPSDPPAAGAPLQPSGSEKHHQMKPPRAQAPGRPKGVALADRQELQFHPYSHPSTLSADRATPRMPPTLTDRAAARPYGLPRRLGAAPLPLPAGPGAPAGGSGVAGTYAAAHQGYAGNGWSSRPQPQPSSLPPSLPPLDDGMWYSHDWYVVPSYGSGSETFSAESTRRWHTTPPMQPAYLGPNGPLSTVPAMMADYGPASSVEPLGDLSPVTWGPPDAAMQEASPLLPIAAAQPASSSGAASNSSRTPRRPQSTASAVAAAQAAAGAGGSTTFPHVMRTLPPSLPSIAPPLHAAPDASSSGPAGPGPSGPMTHGDGSGSAMGVDVEYSLLEEKTSPKLPQDLYKPH